MKTITINVTCKYDVEITREGYCKCGKGGEK